MPRRPPNHLNTEELEQIKMLRAEGLTHHAIGKRISRDQKTVKKACLQPGMVEGIEARKKELADFFEELAQRIMDSITEEDIRKINAYQRIISAGISVDKMRLLREQSTQNISLQALHAMLERKELEKEGQKGSPNS